MSAIIDNVLPVFILIAMGQVLVRFKLLDKQFFAASDRVVYFIFFPAMLFWKISGASGPNGVSSELSILDLAPWVLAAIFIVWGLGLLYLRLAKVAPFQAGTFSQVSYRFNTYVGMAVILTAYGEKGAADFGVLVGVVVPFINVLAVTTLVWYSQANYNGRQKALLVVKALVANPLIISCVAGMAYARLGPPLPLLVQNTLGLMSSITLPLALLSLGAGLSIANLKEFWSLAAAACVFKLLILPAVGLGLLSLAGASGLAFKVAMIYFVLPSSVSCHILSSQLGSDARLAVNAVALTTLASFISLSVALSLLS